MGIFYLPESKASGPTYGSGRETGQGAVGRRGLAKAPESAMESCQSSHFTMAPGHLSRVLAIACDHR